MEVLERQKEYVTVKSPIGEFVDITRIVSAVATHSNYVDKGVIKDSELG